MSGAQLKAFYVDLLVPLETNLEKDTKVVQFEQKKFLQQHKVRADSYSKAQATMKKHRKKKNNTEKEVKVCRQAGVGGASAAAALSGG